jgi:hypothetical protein
VIGIQFFYTCTVTSTFAFLSSIIGQILKLNGPKWHFRKYRVLIQQIRRAEIKHSADSAKVSSATLFYKYRYDCSVALFSHSWLNYALYLKGFSGSKKGGWMDSSTGKLRVYVFRQWRWLIVYPWKNTQVTFKVLCGVHTDFHSLYILMQVSSRKGNGQTIILRCLARDRVFKSWGKDLALLFAWISVALS